MGMGCNPLKEKNKSKTRWFAGIAGAILFLAVLWLLLVRFEGQKPEIIFEQASPYIGKSHDFSISIADPNSGLRKIWIAMIQNGKEVVLTDQDFPSAGIFSGGEIKSKSLLIKHVAFLPDSSFRDYKEKDKSYEPRNIIFPSEDIALAGTISIPQKDGKLPTVLLVGGDHRRNAHLYSRGNLIGRVLPVR